MALLRILLTHLCTKARTLRFFLTSFHRHHGRENSSEYHAFHTNTNRQKTAQPQKRRKRHRCDELPATRAIQEAIYSSYILDRAITHTYFSSIMKTQSLPTSLSLVIAAICTSRKRVRLEHLIDAEGSMQCNAACMYIIPRCTCIRE